MIKKLVKKTLSILAAVLMLASLLPTVVFAADAAPTQAQAEETVENNEAAPAEEG